MLLRLHAEVVVVVNVQWVEEQEEAVEHEECKGFQRVAECEQDAMHGSEPQLRGPAWK